MKGYILKWQNSKVLIVCAFFLDLLKPAAKLCKALQESKVCVVGAIETLRKTSAANEKVKGTPFEELPTVKKILSKIKQKNGSVTHQGVEVTKYDQAIVFLKFHHPEYVKLVQACLRNRIKVQSTELLYHTLTILVTNWWGRSENPSFGYQLSSPGIPYHKVLHIIRKCSNCF